MTTPKVPTAAEPPSVADYPAVRRNEGKARMVAGTSCVYCGVEFGPGEEYRVETSVPRWPSYCLSFWYMHPGCYVPPPAPVCGHGEGI